MDRETVYSSRTAAIRGMWRYYDHHVRCAAGSPLVGEGGEVLQWCDNGRTRHMTCTRDDHDQWLLIKSWIE